MKFKNGLFIFHRDLRLQDNMGLVELNKICENIYPCFIFTPEQVGSKNPYRSFNAVQFMIESLDELSKTIMNNSGRLIILYGDQIHMVHRLAKDLDINVVAFNRDYTPYAISRDKKTLDSCNERGIACYSFSDYYMFEPGTIINSLGNAYKKFTPFYTETVAKNVKPNLSGKITRFRAESRVLPYEIELKSAKALFTQNNPDILVHGGRINGLKRLQAACKEQSEYDERRDFFMTKTTHLSAYIKFGCVSIREVYHAFKKNFGIQHGLIRELIWREFFAHILYAYPNVVGQSYQPRYRSIEWVNNKTAFEKWQNGLTGFPLVDACMRELNKTGYMHNRGRMVVASFLIKTLLIDWRWGEKYFAQKLTDYDLASNNGNWQGISGTGVDMKPYFRDMNPWIQSSKYDKYAEYIKKWVPELSEVAAADIHRWHERYDRPEYNNIQYPRPIVDYAKQKVMMLSLYDNAHTNKT
jgi:deoxyribodipyrimidine photo-lyase